MKCSPIPRSLCGLLGVLCGLSGGALRAQDLSVESEVDASYVGGAGTDLTGGRSGRVDEQLESVHLLATRPIFTDTTLWRLGADYERFSFGLPSRAPLPNTLQSINAVVGVDFEVRGILFRVEAHPGIYTTDFSHLNASDFDMPVIVGGSYIVNKDLQFALGISIDPTRRDPVLPGGGVRWKFADRWLLNAILPRPRVEYQLTDSFTLYAGADVRAATFHVDDNFGTGHGVQRLDGAYLDYTEIRGGGGLRWKVGSTVFLEFETGCLAYRQFDYHRVDYSLENKTGAPYGQFVFTAKF